jgi:hypothetical protein
MLLMHPSRDASLIGLLDLVLVSSAPGQKPWSCENGEYRVFSHPMDSAHICASAYTSIAANRWCYQAQNKQYASLTLSIGCANTLYTR